jgi:hypothetical protein
LIHIKHVYLVPSARLELAKLSPLPPQDSVSTNFTTTAYLACLTGRKNLAIPAFRTVPQFTLKSSGFELPEGKFNDGYFDGIWVAPDAGTSGALATGTGAVTAAPSSTLPELAAGRAVPK